MGGGYAKNLTKKRVAALRLGMAFAFMMYNKELWRNGSGIAATTEYCSQPPNFFCNLLPNFTFLIIWDQLIWILYFYYLLAIILKPSCKIRSEFDCGIFIFGSTFNGFGNKASDMDMNIWLDRTEKMPDKEKLCAVRRLLRKFWR